MSTPIQKHVTYQIGKEARKNLEEGYNDKTSPPKISNNGKIIVDGRNIIDNYNVNTWEDYFDKYALEDLSKYGFKVGNIILVCEENTDGTQISLVKRTTLQNPIKSNLPVVTNNYNGLADAPNPPQSLYNPAMSNKQTEDIISFYKAQLDKRDQEFKDQKEENQREIQSLNAKIDDLIEKLTNKETEIRTLTVSNEVSKQIIERNNQYILKLETKNDELEKNAKSSEAKLNDSQTMATIVGTAPMIIQELRALFQPPQPQINTNMQFPPAGLPVNPGQVASQNSGQFQTQAPTYPNMMPGGLPMNNQFDFDGVN